MSENARQVDTTWEQLRKPFPKEVVGSLPKGGVQLDYVGHAAVTDRLLSVDPEWNWEPLATDLAGLPALDDNGNLWIRLTVGGVTRLGVGDGRNMKERIGDALRNAAMRFGVALDLWSKDELESHVEHPELKNDKPSAPAVAPPAKKLDSEQVAKLLSLAKLKGITDKTEATNFLNVCLLTDDFTQLPSNDFEQYKKIVIEAKAEDDGVPV